MRARPLRAATAPAAALALLTALLTLVGAAGPASAGTAVEIRPAQLERGDDVAVPHVRGSEIVDGDLRIDVGTPYVQLLGTAADDYVVVASGSTEWPGARALRVAPDGTSTVLARRVPLGRVTLSAEGTQLVVARSGRQHTSRLEVRDASTGERQVTRDLAGYVTVLDAESGRVLLSSWRPQRTKLWRLADDRVRTVLRRPAYAGDLGLDRLAWFDDDPYSGGCTVVTPVTEPDTRLWRNCRDAVESWSPDGSRMLTVHKLTDGVGPSEVTLRAGSGTLLARYTIRGWFSSLAWEDGGTVLLGANGRHRFAVVRCDGEDCERASALEPAHQARVAL